MQKNNTEFYNTLSGEIILPKYIICPKFEGWNFPFDNSLVVYQKTFDPVLIEFFYFVLQSTILERLSSTTLLRMTQGNNFHHISVVNSCHSKRVTKLNHAREEKFRHAFLIVSTPKFFYFTRGWVPTRRKRLLFAFQATRLLLSLLELLIRLLILSILRYIPLERCYIIWILYSIQQRQFYFNFIQSSCSPNSQVLTTCSVPARNWILTKSETF